MAAWASQLLTGSAPIATARPGLRCGPCTCPAPLGPQAGPLSRCAAWDRVTQVGGGGTRTLVCAPAESRRPALSRVVAGSGGGFSPPRRFCVGSVGPAPSPVALGTAGLQGRRWGKSWSGMVVVKAACWFLPFLSQSRTLWPSRNSWWRLPNPPSLTPFPHPTPHPKTTNLSSSK